MTVHLHVQDERKEIAILVVAQDEEETEYNICVSSNVSRCCHIIWLICLSYLMWVEVEVEVEVESPIALLLMSNSDVVYCGFGVYWLALMGLLALHPFCFVPAFKASMGTGGLGASANSCAEVDEVFRSVETKLKWGLKLELTAASLLSLACRRMLAIFQR